jgi:hypothetical protein
MMFLPVIGYSIGEWLVKNWDFAQRVDEVVKPYAFNTSLVIGLLIGLLQIGNEYRKTREMSLYAIQQLGFLFAYTFIPLYFGHFVHGLSIFGLIGMGIALVYFIDLKFGANLFMAFPRHFAPEKREKFKDPKAQKIIIELGNFFVLTWIINNSFILFANILLSKPLYLLLLPLFSKFIWIAFMSFCFWYPNWRKKQSAEKQAVLQYT